MKITYYGHASFIVEINNKKLLFDPFISINPLASHIDISSIKTDYILISHGHRDHILDTLEIAKANNATIISNPEISNWFINKGYKNTCPLNTGGKHLFDFGIVKLTNAIHSSVLPDGTNGGNPGGFYIETGDSAFYFAGDTALSMDMKLIGNNKKIIFAFLPIGDTYTMGIDDAIIASDFIKCNTIIGMHYDTFPDIIINKKEAIDKFSASGKKLILMNIGKEIIIN